MKSIIHSGYSGLFENRLVNIDCDYSDREDRNRFAADWISKLLPDSGNILNIGGGGKRHLQSKLGTKHNVFEVDMQGDCDLVFNLDSGPLPLAGRKFELCCAFDVLEHLENFHTVLDDMFEVATQGLLISLPISTGEIIYNNFLFLNKRPNPVEMGVFNKYYGLPLSPPSDRHRWFLSFADVVRFFVNFEEKKKALVNFAVPYKSTKGFKKTIFKMVVGRDRFYEVCVPYVWILISKK